MPESGLSIFEPESCCVQLPLTRTSQRPESRRSISEAESCVGAGLRLKDAES